MVIAANKNDKNTNALPSIRVRTKLALDNGIDAEIVSFSNLCDDGEHVALVFPAAESGKTPLVRLHSECLTGDVLGSAHCDCGDQLREARERIGAEGGILIYLRQEGRGIGLYNKLDAYKVQNDQGLDTFAANKHIGFEEDPRNFEVAAQMLHAMNIRKIRLLTNNPDKLESLRRHDIEVEEAIPTGRYEKDANRHYLETKRRKGHTV